MEEVMLLRFEQTFFILWSNFIFFGLVNLKDKLKITNEVILYYNSTLCFNENQPCIWH